MTLVLRKSICNPFKNVLLRSVILRILYRLVLLDVDSSDLWETQQHYNYKRDWCGERDICRIHRSELIQDNVCKGGTIRDRPIICLSDYCFKYCAIICICVCCPIAENIKKIKMCYFASDAAYSLCLYHSVVSLKVPLTTLNVTSNSHWIIHQHWIIWT